MNDPTLPLSGLSSVGGKSVVARFDGGMLSSNSGVLALAEVEKRLRVAERLARSSRGHARGMSVSDGGAVQTIRRPALCLESSHTRRSHLATRLARSRGSL